VGLGTPKQLVHQVGMTLDVFSALALLTLITSLTPRPNNLMLMA
jgi:hypothetical protein